MSRLRYPETPVDTLRRWARKGLSFADVAQIIGCSRGAVASRARRAGVQFRGAFSGGGCNREQALKGWETRRATGRHC